MIPTPHNIAAKEQIAKTVVMPGDPMRSRYIVETFLSDAQLVNNVRGIQGYTGLYEGKPVTVMASGMGISSISIYAYELYNFYDVDCIIRVGTTGGIQPDLKVGEIILSDVAFTDSTFYRHLNLPADYVAKASPDVLKIAEEAARKRGIHYVTGPVLTEEIYYSQEENYVEYWAEKGVLAFEMEAAALYANATQAGKKALSLFTVSNNILTGEEMDSADRERSLNEMIRIGLDTAVSL